jgi:hypothetical protein
MLNPVVKTTKKQNTRIQKQPKLAELNVKIKANKQTIYN